MSLVSVDEVKALVGTSLDDAVVQDIIDREEAYLTSRIGLLYGERDQRVLLYDASDPFWLVRPADDVVVSSTLGGTAITGTEVISGGWRVWRPNMDWPFPGQRGSSLFARYTPNDEENVRRVLIELCRLTISVSNAQSSGIASEQIGAYSYRNEAGASLNAPGNPAMPSRGGLVRSLLPRYPLSVRVRSAGADPWGLYPTVR